MIVITGASRGIGRACAEKFAAHGYDILAIARGKEGLAAMGDHWEEHFPDSRLETFSADLCTENGCRATQLFIQARPLEVTALVHNVGSYQAGNLLDKEDPLEQLLHINVLAAHRLSRGIIPGMITRQQGHVITIGSVAASDFGSHMLAYSVSKYALHGWQLALEKELKGSGVRTTLVVPGATLTSAWVGEDYDAKRILAPEQVAEAAWYAFSAPAETEIRRVELRPPA